MIQLTASHCDNPEKYLPIYKSNACAELVACIPPNIYDKVDIGSQIKFGFRTLSVINCGFSVAVPNGFKLCISLIDTLASQGMFLTNSPAQISSDNHENVKVIIANFSHSIITIKDGDVFAQCWLEPVYKAEWNIVTELPKNESLD
jgi:dUTPase